MPPIDDRKIWTAYAKGVKPLKPSKTGKPSTAVKERKTKTLSSTALQKPGQQTSTGFYASLGHKDERCLRTGTIAIEARLDLHGMYQAEAHRALIDFVARQAKAGRRHLLVITGKGRGGEGVLRARLADWLAAADIAVHIRALRPAAPRHGGTGAFYLILKKLR